ncbi:MAG: 50S ribosomal protein L4 [Methanobacteriota archaeon]|nr:MAG: 50S ribosomal protein L4 [Euryarchaeota archaeon]
MAAVYDVTGKKVSTVELPSVFDTAVRPDLIRRAVVAIQSHRLQPYGPDWLSGKRTSASSYGPGRGLSRIKRVRGGGPASGKGAIAPHVVGGRRAHPPLPERNLKKRINRKERVLATASAIAATADRELVKARGHAIGDDMELPLIVEEAFEGLEKTREVRDVLVKLGLEDDLSRGARKGRNAGKGKRRGRAYRRRKSALIVVSGDGGVRRAAENLPGVDVALASDLNAEDLAPGGNPARLTIYTVAALKELEKRFKEAV